MSVKDLPLSNKEPVSAFSPDNVPLFFHLTCSALWRPLQDEANVTLVLITSKMSRSSCKVTLISTASPSQFSYSPFALFLMHSLGLSLVKHLFYIKSYAKCC